MKLLKIICLLIIMIGCNHKNNNKNSVLKSIDRFPLEINLIHKKIETPPLLYMVCEMILTDSVLITMDMKSNTIFQVFKLPKFDYLRGLVKKGAGPNEENQIFPDIRFLGKNQFLYRNITSIKIRQYDSRKNELEVVKGIKLPGKLLDFYNIFQLNDDNVYYGVELNGRSGNKEFIAYNHKDRSISEFGPEYPQIGIEPNYHIMLMIFAKITSVKPDKSQFASVYDKFPILRIYSKEGKLKAETRYINGNNFPDLLPNGKFRADANDIVQNYRKIKTTNKYIYALYVGKTMKQIEATGNAYMLEANEIHVWDWHGNPIKKIMLDQRIFTFDVAKDDSYFICSSLDYLDALFKYDLP